MSTEAWSLKEIGDLATGAFSQNGCDAASTQALMRFSFEAEEADNQDGGPPRGGEFHVGDFTGSPGGSGLAEHCEVFFGRFDAIEGAPAGLALDTKTVRPLRVTHLLGRIRALCN